MSNKWKKERASFAGGKKSRIVEPEIPIELSPIPDSEKTEINSMLTDLRKSISAALDYFAKIDKSSVFAAPVGCALFIPNEIRLPYPVIPTLSRIHAIYIQFALTPPNIEI
jgi:hypothetical protein